MSKQSALNLLLVEDHPALREMFSLTLQDLGYNVTAYDSAEATLAQSNADRQIALLDVNLPGEDGLYLAQQLRFKNPNIGIIITTVRNQVADKLAGYQSGADMYLPKPVTPEELDAAIQSLARRLPEVAPHDLTLTAATLQLSNQQKYAVTLSSDECRLLTALAAAPQQRQEYWELAEKLDLDLDSSTLRATLEKRVSRLRKKLVELEQPSTTIKTLRNVGYELTVKVKIMR